MVYNGTSETKWLIWGYRVPLFQETFKLALSQNAGTPVNIKSAAVNSCSFPPNIADKLEQISSL